MKLKLIILLSIFFTINLPAMEVMYLARSPRALLMGDAFTAVADDEYSLYYNPATLGRNKGVSFTALPIELGIPDPLTGMSKFTNFPSTPQGIANKIMDYPIYLQGSIMPSFKMAHFGMNLLLNNQTSFILRNSIHPTLNIKQQYDRGFVMGGAWNLGDGSFLDKKEKKSKKTKNSAGERVSLGFAVKYINRQGIDGSFDLFGTKLLNTISSNTSVSSIKNALGFSSGTGWGYDVGAEYSRTVGSSTFNLGYSILDIGNTRFTKTSGTYDVPNQQMMTNLGTSFKQDFGVFDYTLSMDLHPFLGPVDFGRQLHFGARVGVPFVTAFGGWSEGYLSYGATVDVWPFDFTMGWYGVETGAKYKQAEARRFIFYMSLFDFSIDL